jgi:hypothetical protein
MKENMAIAGVDISKLEGASPEAILAAANAKKAEKTKPEFKKDKGIKKSDAKPYKKPQVKSEVKSEVETEVAATSEKLAEK